MKWLLDTNALSELTKPSPNEGLLEWLETNEPDTAISSISIGEMVLGVERLPESKRRRSLERALRFLREDYAGKILDFTEGVAVEWGRLVADAQKKGRKLSTLDSQIEATASHFRLFKWFAFMLLTNSLLFFLVGTFTGWLIQKLKKTD